MNRNLRPVHALLAATLALTFSSGCGTGAYNEKVAEAKTRLKSQAGQQAILSKLGNYVPIPGTNLSIRPPAGYDEVPAKNTDGSEPHAEEKYPAGVRLPGYVRTYEKAIDRQKGSQTWVAIYIAGGPIPDEGGESVRTTFANDLKSALPQASTTWEATPLPTPDGQTTSVQKLSAAGSIGFRSKKGGPAEIVDEPGKAAFYWYESGGNYALVGWIRPDAFTPQHTDVEAVAGYMAATIKASEQPNSRTPSQPTSRALNRPPMRRRRNKVCQEIAFRV